MEAVKYDSEKPKLGLVPPRAVTEIGKAMTYGSKKYEDYNYKKGDGLDWNRYYDALLRHINAWLGGEEYDPESGLRHTSHAGACMVMLIDAVESGIGKDTRFRDPRTPKEHARAFDTAAENLKRYVKSGESEWPRIPALGRIENTTCTYYHKEYDITKPGLFPIKVLLAFADRGILSEYSSFRICEKGDLRTYSIDQLRLFRERSMWYDGIGRSGFKIFDDVPAPVMHKDKVERYHHKYALRYRGKAYNIKVPGMFPAPVLKKFRDLGMISGNAVCYSGIGKWGKFKVSKIMKQDWSQEYWYDPSEKRLWHDGKVYDFKTNGWFPRKLLLDAHEHNMLPDYTMCWAESMTYTTSLHDLSCAEKYRWPDQNMRYPEYFIYGQVLEVTKKDAD